MAQDATTGWDPEQYERFRDERLQPARDLIATIETGPLRVLDLGCGTGEVTALLAAHLGPAARVEGIDTSDAMLARAAPRATDALRFRRADAGALDSFAGYDLVFSNAALQWVPDHERLFARLLSTLPAAAQIAVQMPWNQHHPAHLAAAAVAADAPFAGWLGGFVQRTAAQPLERYAEWLFAHGYSRTRLWERVYCHRLSHSDEVVEWVKGTLLVPYLQRLQGERRDAFLDAYRRRLRRAIGESSPYLLTFRRLFLWARRD